jgi:hypothetical protein
VPRGRAGGALIPGGAAGGGGGAEPNAAGRQREGGRETTIQNSDDLFDLWAPTHFALHAQGIFSTPLSLTD